MREILTLIVKKITGKGYFHIPKWFWLRNLLRKVLVVERVRGRGRNWKTISEKEAELHATYSTTFDDGMFVRHLDYDGHVPLKYASYLYIKLK